MSTADSILRIQIEAPGITQNDRSSHNLQSYTYDTNNQSHISDQRLAINFEEWKRQRDIKREEEMKRKY